jgi:hypothetical protein
VPAGTSAMQVGSLTLIPGRAYHPRDDERADALTGARRVCVPLGVGTVESPRPDGEDRKQPR